MLDPLPSPEFPKRDGAGAAGCGAVAGVTRFTTLANLLPTVLFALVAGCLTTLVDLFKAFVDFFTTVYAAFDTDYLAAFTFFLAAFFTFFLAIANFIFFRVRKLRNSTRTRARVRVNYFLRNFKQDLLTSSRVASRLPVAT
jgi:hypothetical protein